MSQFISGERVLRVWLVAIAVFVLDTAGAVRVLAQEATFAPDIAKRIGEALEGRRFSSTETARGLRDVYAAAVYAVPFIITKSGSGSGVVVALDGTGAVARVVTNHHVAASAWQDKDGIQSVYLVFYEPRLAQETFDGERVVRCFIPGAASSWCQLVRSVVRVGVVVAADQTRDLALIDVLRPPLGVRPIPFESLPDVRPGDDVSVIGHPLGYVWTLTTGIVSALRSNYLIGDSPNAFGVTVVQTQTPINPGNSGGPLLSAKGGLVGVIAASALRPMKTSTGVDVDITAAGLNLAIAVTEVRDFIIGRAVKPR